MKYAVRDPYFVPATIKADRLFRNMKKHLKVISQAIKDLSRCILNIGGFEDTENISVIFEDGIIEDKATIRENDRLDVDKGLMKKWEYRMKYYGETKEIAKEMAGD